MSPAITDENLLRLLELKQYNINLFCFEITKLSTDANITFEALKVDNPSFVDPVLFIAFRYNKRHAGSFSYTLMLNNKGKITMNHLDSYFYGADNRRLKKHEAIEKLMEYKEIKEWLIWNQLP